MTAPEAGIMRNALHVLIVRELRALDREIASYPDDDSVWKQTPGTPNSAGTLTLHLAGNLRHFIGATMAGSGYVRDRAAEFGSRDLTRDELRAVVRDTIAELEVAFEKISDAQLAAEFPLQIAQRTVRAADFLLHLAVHLGYHLGQIDYHRRILTNSAATVDAMAIHEIG